MKKLLVCLLLCSVLLVGCSGPVAPTVEEAPYFISWSGPDGFYGRVYCDNYELGSSVVIDGYWEMSGGFSNEYLYMDKLLILDASEVTIEERGAE